MSTGQKLVHELKAVGLAMLYFGTWIGTLLALKHLILAEYKIAAGGWTVIAAVAMFLF